MGEPKDTAAPEHPERYEQRLKKLRGPEVHEWEGALVPDPTPNWVFQDVARHLNAQQHEKKLEDEQKHRQAVRELSREEEQFTIQEALPLEKDKGKEEQSSEDEKDDKKKKAGKPKPPVTGDKTNGTVQQQPGKGKAGAKAGAAKAAGKVRRLNDPEEDRRLAEANGIVYIDQGSTRIDLDTGEIVLTETLVPRKWEFSVLKPDYTVVLFGRRGTGKSFLLRNILYAMRHIFAFGIVFSRTEVANGFFSDFIPESFIYDDVYPEAIERLMKMQADRRRAVDIKRPDFNTDLVRATLLPLLWPHPRGVVVRHSRRLRRPENEVL